jgi:hypothetical protein
MSSIQDKINELISAASLQQPFSQQKGGQRCRTLKCFKNLLRFLSGEDIAELLNTYLISKDGKSIMDQIGIQFKSQSIDIINNIKDLHQKTSKNNKHKILSLVSNTYTRKQLIEMGFQFSSGQFTTSRKEHLISDKQIKHDDKDDKDLYHSFLNNSSREASNRTVYVKRRIDEVIEDIDINIDEISGRRSKKLDLKRKSCDDDDAQAHTCNVLLLQSVKSTEFGFRITRESEHCSVLCL